MKAAQPDPTGWCFCGCGSKVQPGKYFIQTHDRTAEATILSTGRWAIVSDRETRRGSVGPSLAPLLLPALG
jgi:hypothetical protein